VTFNTVPEPGTVAIGVAMFVLIAFRAWKKRRAV
jgi:hypothetical protein